jgi:hypothetical protein
MTRRNNKYARHVLGWGKIRLENNRPRKNSTKIKMNLSKILPFGFYPWMENKIDNRLKDSKKYLVYLDDGEIIEAFYDDYTDDFSRPPFWIIKYEIKIGSKIEKETYCIKDRVKGWKYLDTSN